MFSEIIQIAKRETRLLWNDSRTRSVVLVAPVLYALLFSAVYSNHSLTELPIGIMCNDHSASSRTLIRMLDASSKLKVARQVESVDDLKDLIYDSRLVGAIVIPKDFTERLKRGKDAHVTAYVNAASMVSANTAAKAINETVVTFSAGVELKTLMKKGERLEAAKEKWMPVKLDLRSLFNPSFNYSNFMVPGLLIAVLQQVILMALALCWTGEKEKGSLGDLFQITRSPVRLLIGKAIPYVAINFIIAEFYLRILFPMNDIPMEGAWYVAIPFTLLFILTIVSWGMWMGALFKTRLFATQALMFLAMPSFVLSGFTWPQEGMPLFIRALAQLLPMTHFVTSFRNIYLGGAPGIYILGSVLTLVAFLAVNVALSLYVIKRIAATNATA
jgi:ABC-2 type transport system permease protein